MEEVKSTNTDKLKEMSDSISKLMNSNLMEQSLMNNELEYTLDGVRYRASKPTFAQRQEVYRKQSARYLELLKDNTFAFEADLVKLYKARGIDADSYDRDIKRMSKQRDDLLYKLGEAIKEMKVAENELERMKKEIENINIDIQQLMYKRASLFETSIETQIQVFIYSYLTYLVTDKLVVGKDLGNGNKEDDKWVKAWNTYDEFINSSDKLINQVLFYASLLIKNEVEQ